jgi:alcohol dehydrogenase
VKAAVLEAFGKPLSLREVRDPHIGSGEVLVKVLATCIPPYAAEVFSGERSYPLEPPVVSGVGAIGRVVAADLQAGETVLISGATGNFGSAGVAVALAMGAAAVVCPGRNQRVLDDLKLRFGERIRTVKLTGDGDTDRSAMQATAPDSIDVVLDLLPPSVGTGPVRTAAMTVRPYGRVVLMGGVGMLGGGDLELPYPWLMRNSVTVRGQWMYPRSANHSLIQMIRSGVLDLGHEAVTTFRLRQVNEAVAYAAAHGGPFDRTVLLPRDDVDGVAGS